MKYTIFHVGDTRQHYIDDIRANLSQYPTWTEVHTQCVDGRIDEQLAEAQNKWSDIKVAPATNIGGFPRRGHLGIWYTVLNAMEHGPVVTFEDDAILKEHLFELEFYDRFGQIPEDADFFSLFIPRDSDHMFKDRHDFGARSVCRAYQGYGGVSMYYTERGIERIMNLLRRDGLYNQYDNQLYNYSWHGELNGYTSKPSVPDLVRISGTEDSIVQETDQL